jgi:hypothetical protein
MTDQEKYIQERMKDFAQNINGFSVNDIVIDSDKAECIITNKTLNSIEVFIRRKISPCISCNVKGTIKKDVQVEHHTWWKRIFGIKMKIKINVQCEECLGVGKTHYGVDCKSWFDMKSFNKRFKKK